MVKNNFKLNWPIMVEYMEHLQNLNKNNGIIYQFELVK